METILHLKDQFYNKFNVYFFNLSGPILLKTLPLNQLFKRSLFGTIFILEKHHTSHLYNMCPVVCDGMRRFPVENEQFDYIPCHMSIICKGFKL